MPAPAISPAPEFPCIRRSTSRCSLWSLIGGVLLAAAGLFLPAGEAGAAGPNDVPAVEGPADVILHGGKVVTVDANFRIAEAVAIKGDRILAVGTTAEMKQHAGDGTKMVDLKGRTVLPGLIDSHVHSTGASMYEYDHPVPDMETIGDVLQYIRGRVEVVEDGDWIVISQVFITRLRDRRFPNRRELDSVAPKNPVVFRTGPDAALNSLALQESGIDRDFKMPEGSKGYIERDPKTGEPNGILRSCGGLIKYGRRPQKKSTTEGRVERLRLLFADYNRVGLTSVADRSASDGGITLYQALKDEDRLTCRVYLYYGVGAGGSLESIEKRINKAATHPLHEYDNMLWLRGIKIFLDGGMLTGSAYMKKPWGVSTIYSITDPEYRGLLYVEPEKLARISYLALSNGLQMTAHSVGDGAVEALARAYSAVNKELPVRPLRPCITHCNFMSRDAIALMKELGIVADLQPAWLFLDGSTLRKQFGDERLTYFQPYRTLFDDYRRRLRPHAENRREAGGEPVQPVPGNVDRPDPAAALDRRAAAPGAADLPRTGHSPLYDEQRLADVRGEAERFAGTRQTGRPDHPAAGHSHLPGRPGERH